ncbi:uncharacterized protein METZ01_LOCUS449918, partial [marine metagenome]
MFFNLGAKKSIIITTITLYDILLTYM